MSERIGGCTWVFPPSAPLDKADNEEDEHNESHSTHYSNEPALSGDVHLVLSINCVQTKTQTNKHIQKHIQYIHTIISVFHKPTKTVDVLNYFLWCSGATLLYTTPLFQSEFVRPRRICIECSGHIFEWRRLLHLEGTPQLAVPLLWWHSL